MSKDNKNMTVLKRLDPNILEIKDTFSHVVVYELIEMTWKRKGIEGTAFLVSNADSSESLFIMNRLSLENHVFNLKLWRNLEILDDYIFYEWNGIYGIWIYDPKDRNRFRSILQNATAKMTANYNMEIAPITSHPSQISNTFTNLDHLWKYIDPHHEKLDFVTFKTRILNPATLEALYSTYIIQEM